MSQLALVTGITGQDGCYLAKILLEKGWKVVGAKRRGASLNTWRLQEEGIDGDIEFVDLELSEPMNIRAVIEELEPDVVYNLAAMSFVGTSFEQPAYTHIVNALGPINLLSAIEDVLGYDCSFYQASTSEMYGGSLGGFSNENTIMLPRSPYAIAKLSAFHSVRCFREEGGFGVNGILFNHESKYRGIEFVTRKICVGLAYFAATKEPVILGNVNAERDWGHAEDYMRGAFLMMQHSEADDWVLATGQKHSVKEFFNRAAEYLGYDPQWTTDDMVCIDRRTGDILAQTSEQLWRPLEVDDLKGDAYKARSVLGWEPRHSFESLVGEMMRTEITRFSREANRPVL
jgi:GDPmannose 4,6-dehydratase